MGRLSTKLLTSFVLGGAVVTSSALASASNQVATAAPKAKRGNIAAQLLLSRERIAQATVTLPEKSCAGAVVWQSDRVLTAAHCIQEGVDRIQVTLRDGRFIDSSLEYLDRDADLALLHLDESSSIEPLPVATDLPRVSSSVLFVGRVDRPSKTQVARIERLGRCPSLPKVDDAVFTTVRAYPGDSGAPIVDRDGRVVAVIHGGASCHIAAPTATLGQKLAANLLEPMTNPPLTAAETANGTPTKSYRIGPFIVESLPHGFRFNWSFNWGSGTR